MTKFGKLVVGSLVGAALTLGISGAALAAPVTSTTTGSPSTTAGTTGTTSPSTTPPAQASPAKAPLTRTAVEIWLIVRPHHPVDCARSAQQLKRVRAADAAAAKRLGRWSGKNSADAKRRGKHAAVRVKHATDKVRVFQKLEQDGQALIARIDAKCGAANSSK